MIPVFGIQTILGYLLDLLAGDPPSLPHPVVLIGRGIKLLENTARRVATSPAGLKVAGIGIAIVIPVFSYGLTFLALWLAWQINLYLSLVLGAWLVSTTVATKGLADAARAIGQLLMNSDLAQARQKVGWIVGRDTTTMQDDEIVRATVETVAENTVDAVVAPLFYACLGGPPLAMAYRAINTMDSMLGYKNKKYRDLGRAAAKLDDIANYLPARLTGLFMVIATWFTNRNWQRAINCWVRDAASHPSPNSGVPESVMAGAIGVQLGGVSVYHGTTSFRPHLGDAVESLRPDHIDRATHMLYVTAAMAALACTLVSLLIWHVTC